MAVNISSNVRKRQRKYVKEMARYFYAKDLNPNNEVAWKQAHDVYNQMLQTLNGLPTSIATSYSPHFSFHKGYPFVRFQSSDNSRMWYFAYIKNENGDVLIFDMKSANEINEEVEKSLDFMQRLLEVKI